MGPFPTNIARMWLRSSLGGLSRGTAVRIVAVLVLCAVAVVRHPTWPPDTLWLVALLVAGFGSRMFLRYLAPFLVLFLLYFVLSGLADDINPTVHYMPMANFDMWLAGGDELPTRWLQQHMWDGELRWYDFYFYLLYTAHFVMPLVVALVVWKRRPQLYWVFVGAVMGLSFAAFVTYVAFPAAPPWMSSDYGYIPRIHRVSHDIWQAVGIADPDTLYSRLSPNLVAAVPSLHASYPLVILIFLAAVFGWRRVWWVAFYPVSLWIGIVYMGEHYVFDILAGVVYTVVASALAFRIAALLRGRRERARRQVVLAEAAEVVDAPLEAPPEAPPGVAADPAERAPAGQEAVPTEGAVGGR